MAEITADMVKQLREATGARLLDCQKALKESNADIKAAMDWLRKQNLSKGGETQSRSAEEGLLGHKADGNKLAVVELSANTDFVAKNDEFRKLLEQLVDLTLTQKLGSGEKLLAAQLNGRPVSEVVKELAGKIGENIAVKKAVYVEGEFGYYMHHDSKQAAVVELSGLTGEKATAVGKQLAMHIVSAKPVPICITREQVPADLVAKEKEIVSERLKTDPKNSKKPPEILAKIAEGQLGNFYSERCLLEQGFLGDSKNPVTKFLKEQGPDAGIKAFHYFKVGA
jgi:elongation factor Ts